MKIGYDAKRYYHNNTGLGNYSRTLVKAITSQYNDVEAMLYDSKSIERTFRLGRRAKKDGCALFHGLSNEIPRDMAKAGIPSIVTMHDVAWRTFPNMYKPIDRLIYDIKYGWSARNASHVVCISESTKRDVMHYYGVAEEKISVIYQPVQSIFYTPMGAEESLRLMEQALPYLNGRPYILTVGTINSRKNLWNMVRAYNKMETKKRPAFIVVGNGREYRRKVEEYIKENKLQNDVHIESNIHDGRILQALYSNALCMIYPSFYEGFGLPVVEAALQHCPVITSNVSSLPEAAGEDAILCNPSSVKELTGALQLLISDENGRKQRGAACYDYCMGKFDPFRLTEQMHELYQTLS